MTQQEKIFTLIIANQSKEWWVASDFMDKGLGELFVGYEASPRMSEIVRDYPFAFDVRRNGKFREIKFNFENTREIYQKMPKNLQRIIRLYQPKLLIS